VSQKYELMFVEKAYFSVSMMAGLLGVSRSGYYAWEQRQAGPPSATVRRRGELAVVITHLFTAFEHTYGYRRIHRELRRSGTQVDDELVRQIMREEGLTPVQVTKRRPGLTRQDKQAGPIPDLVGRDFTAQAPGAKMVGDITQIDTLEGKLFLATVIDCYSKAVLGYAIDEQYPAELCCAAIDAAAKRIRFPKNAIFHSDRGSQYTSHTFALKLKKHDITQSVGRTGICYDNAMAESFFGKLKTEWIHHRTFQTKAEARREIIRYIDGFYNTRRLHSGLDYRPPFEKLQEWFDNQKAA
jgi:putative transposase